MIKLIEKNIRAVERSELAGETYRWEVSLQRGDESDLRCFSRVSLRRATEADDYKLDELPEPVQRFVRSHAEILVDECGQYRWFVYR